LLDALLSEEVRLIVCVRCAGAKHRLAVSIKIVGKAEVRIELQGGVFREVGRDSLITKEEHSSGSIRVHRAVLVGCKRCHVEYTSTMKVVVRKVQGLPAKTGRHGQPGGGMERILHVQSGDRSTQRILLRIALLEAAQGSLE
jgi:hypothetical protein